jgi:hypothetical protein
MTIWTVTFDNGSEVQVMAWDAEDAMRVAEAEAERDGYGGLRAIRAVGGTHG